VGTYTEVLLNPSQVVLVADPIATILTKIEESKS
jgi:hypothetical protein